MEWKNIYVFISSTFNDMHAERDFLVKRVFPELRVWCAKRHLKLRDIDLRWGVSAADAQENKRVVEVCLRNIDKCRPFFLCFMGQRRGWVPGSADVNPAVLDAFPDLAAYIGANSVTELEILHALLHPMAGESPVKHFRFYARDDHYLRRISDPRIKKLFSPENALFSRSGRDYANFKRRIGKQFGLVDYTADWLSDKRSPELSNVGGQDLSAGRLGNFRTGDRTLEADVLAWLRDAIAAEYPDHTPVESIDDPLELELAQQDIQLFEASDGYIPRPSEEAAIRSLLSENETPVILSGDAGSGKTFLLANLIQEEAQSRRLYYRFAGTTLRSASYGKLLSSLVKQWIRDGLLPEDADKYPESELKVIFPTLLQTAGEASPFLLVLDGMDQLPARDNWAKFLPKTLPRGCGMLLSYRKDSLKTPPAGYPIHHLGAMSSRADQEAIIKSYLAGFLKDVDEEQTKKILDMKGSANPLFLKILLNELRVHGSFDTLMDKLNQNYGDTPSTAFQQFLYRLHEEYTALYPFGSSLLFTFASALALSQEAVDTDMLLYVAYHLTEMEKVPRQEFLDALHAIIRETEPFLVESGDGYAFRYDSLRRAVHAIYRADALQAAHNLLAGAYNEKADRTGSSDDQSQVMYHLLRGQEEVIRTYFASFDEYKRCLKHGSAALLADTCQKLSRDRNLSEYAPLGAFYAQAGSRLEVNPDTLFMELRQHTDVTSPAIARLMAEEEHAGTLRYFLPLSPSVTPEEKAAGIGPQKTPAPALLRTFTVRDDIHEMALVPPYLIEKTNRQLFLRDAKTLELLNVAYFWDDRFFDHDCTSHMVVGKDRVAILFNSYKFIKFPWLVYSLPDLTILHNEVMTATSYGYQAQSFFIGEDLYAACSYLHFKEKTADLSCVVLNKDRVLWQEHFDSNVSEACAGEYAFFEEYALTRPCRWILVHIPTGRVMDSGTLSSFHNPTLGVGRYLYLSLSGAMHQELRQYEIASDGSLTLRQDITPPYSGIHHLWEIGGRYLFANKDGLVTIMDTELQKLGEWEVNYGDNHGHNSSWGGQFILLEEDELMVLGHPVSKVYSLQGILRGLVQETGPAPKTPKGNSAFFPAVAKDGFYYRFTPLAQKYNLQEGTYTQEAQPSFHPIGMVHTPAHLLSKPHRVAGSGVGSGLLSLRDFTGEVPTLDYQKPLDSRDRQYLLHAVYQYTGEYPEITMVVADKAPIRRRYRGEEHNYFHLHLVTVCLHPILKDSLVTREDLKLECSGTDYAPELGMADRVNVLPLSITDKKSCMILLPNLYQDEKSFMVKLLDLGKKEFIHTTVCKSKVHALMSTDYHCLEDGFFFSYRDADEDQTRLVHYDRNTNKIYNGSVTGYVLPGPVYNGELFLANPGEKTLTVYATKDHRLEAPFEDIYAADKVEFIDQAVRLDNWVLVRKQGSSDLEVYDATSKKLLFRQRFDRVLGELHPDPLTKTICENTQDGLARLFRAVEQ